MDMDNFPEFEEPKPTFLLHPNSLHFVFKHQLETEGRNRYSSQVVNLMFKVFLRRRNMLTNWSEAYLDDYWEDIIELVNNPKER